MAGKPSKAASALESINYHGTFFKRAVIRELETIRKLPMYEEFPVLMDDVHATDIVYEFKVEEQRFRIAIECKRARPSVKEWIFFPERQRVGHKTTGSFVLTDHGTATIFEAKYSPIVKDASLCVEGLEVTKDGQDFSANTSTIFETANQVLRNYAGLVEQEKEERRTAVTFAGDNKISMFPMVVTSAPLFVAEFDENQIDIVSGNYLGDFESQKRRVPFLLLNHPFIPQDTKGNPLFSLSSGDGKIPKNQYHDLRTRSYTLKHSLVVVNATHLKDFFQSMEKEYSI